MKKSSSYTARVGATHKYCICTQRPSGELAWEARLPSLSALLIGQVHSVLEMNAWKQVLVDQTHGNKTTFIDSFQKLHHSVFPNST